MKTIAIIPAFNEEKRIRDVIRQVRLADAAVDIVVVDDCSRDATAGAAAEEGAVILSHAVNLGYGAALQTGYAYALRNGYDVLVQLDADGQHEPRYIPEMIKTLKAGGCDVVIGSRYRSRTGYRSAWTRRMGTRLFSFLIRVVTGKNVADPTSGYRVMNRRLLPLLVSDLFPCDFPDADFIIILQYAGYSVAEYPVEMRLNQDGKSMHSGIANQWFYVFRMCLSIFLLVLGKKKIVTEACALEPAGGPVFTAANARAGSEPCR